MAGEPNVKRLLRRLTAKEFLGWEAYWALRPQPSTHLDYLAALICQTIANVNRGARQRPYKVEDFLPRWGVKEADKRQSQAQQFAFVSILAAMHANDKVKT